MHRDAERRQVPDAGRVAPRPEIEAGGHEQRRHRQQQGPTAAREIGAPGRAGLPGPVARVVDVAAERFDDPHLLVHQCLAADRLAQEPGASRQPDRQHCHPGDGDGAGPGVHGRLHRGPGAQHHAAQTGQQSGGRGVASRAHSVGKDVGRAPECNTAGALPRFPAGCFKCLTAMDFRLEVGLRAGSGPPTGRSRQSCERATDFVIGRRRPPAGLIFDPQARQDRWRLPAATERRICSGRTCRPKR